MNVRNKARIMLFGLLGFVACYGILLLGVFLALDAFIPKSKPISFCAALTEFMIGVIIASIAYFFVRKIQVWYRSSKGVQDNSVLKN